MTGAAVKPRSPDFHMACVLAPSAGSGLLATLPSDGGNEEEDAQQQTALPALKFWGRSPNMR